MHVTMVPVSKLLNIREQNTTAYSSNTQLSFLTGYKLNPVKHVVLNFLVKIFVHTISLS